MEGEKVPSSEISSDLMQNFGVIEDLQEPSVKQTPLEKNQIEVVLPNPNPIQGNPNPDDALTNPIGRHSRQGQDNPKTPGNPTPKQPDLYPGRGDQQENLVDPNPKYEKPNPKHVNPNPVEGNPHENPGNHSPKIGNLHPVPGNPRMEPGNPHPGNPHPKSGNPNPLNPLNPSNPKPGNPKGDEEEDEDDVFKDPVTTKKESKVTSTSRKLVSFQNVPEEQAPPRSGPDEATSQKASRETPSSSEKYKFTPPLQEPLPVTYESPSIANREFVMHRVERLLSSEAPVSHLSASVTRFRSYLSPPEIPLQQPSETVLTWVS